MIAGSSPDHADAAALHVDERRELERLRREVAALKQHGDDVTSSRSAGGDRWRQGLRATASAVLIVLSCLLAPLAVTAVWLRGEVTDTDRYVATVAPLAQDPALQRAVAAQVTDIVFHYVDVQGLARQTISTLEDQGALPAPTAVRLAALTGPLVGGLQSITQDKVVELTRTDAFAAAWVTANRAVHRQLVVALTGQQGGALVIRGDVVAVDLSPFVAVAKQYLIASGFQLADRLPQVHATFPVFRSAQVARWQRAFRALDLLGLWLSPLLVITCAAGVLLARGRRRAVTVSGLGISVGMLVAGATLAWGRSAYLDGLPPSTLPPDAAAVLFDTVVRFLRDALRAAFLAGLVVAAGAYLSGPAPVAVRLRSRLVRGLAVGKRALGGAGTRQQAVTRSVAAYARMLRIGSVAVVTAVVLIERYRTPQLVVQATAVLLLALAVIEFLAVEPASAGPVGVTSSADRPGPQPSRGW